ncbi:MAG: DNA replication and repair protein RecF [Acidimicrobiales bacterium]
MGLHELTLRNFRPFQELVFEPDPEAITVLLSANGTGKTSVLEAVYALTTASSFRTSAASDMIRSGEHLAEVHGVLFQQQRRVQVDLTLTRGTRNTTKKMLVNGQRPSSRASVSEVLPLTVFTPEGVDIVRQGPEHRRTYLTNLLTDVDLSTGDVIERFTRVLSQRNAVLRSFQGEPPSVGQREELGVWDAEFCEASEQLVEVRLQLLARLETLIMSFYQAIAQNNRAVSARYERSWTGELNEALRNALKDDQYRGHSTIGPQRDDIALLLDGRDARRQASQGEQRSLALALRLAGHELVRQQRGLDPLLLLDDVFSELDPLRSDRLLQLLPAGQTLVTTASPLPSAMHPAAIVDLSQVIS